MQQMQHMVLGPQRSTPMHTRDSTSKDNSADETLPPATRPRCLEDAEQRQGDHTRRHSNDDRPSHIGNRVGAPVVGDGGVSNVVHARDGAACKRARNNDAPPCRDAEPVLGCVCDDVKGNE